MLFCLEAEVGEPPFLTLNFHSGKLKCSVCGREFEAYNYKPVDIRRKTMQRWFSNRPNAERHLWACFRKAQNNRPLNSDGEKHAAG